MAFNPQGTAVLLETTTDLDATIITIPDLAQARDQGRRLTGERDLSEEERKRFFLSQ
jgi:hypothetical protein